MAKSTDPSKLSDAPIADSARVIYAGIASTESDASQDRQYNDNQ